MAATVLLLILSAGSLRHKRVPAILSALHLGVAGIVATLMAVVIASRFFSEYSLLLSDVFLMRLLVLTALPLLLAGGWKAALVFQRPRILPWSRLLAVGLVVGGVFLWKVFVGWVFFDEFGMEAVAPHPDNNGMLFGGVLQMWTAIRQGSYVNGTWELARSGVLYAVLTTAAAALAVMSVIVRPGPIAFAALAYALMTVTFNSQGVWLHPANAQRLTIDLFVALALLFLQIPRDRPLARRAFTAFWAASALYVFIGNFEASFIQRSMFHWFWPF